MYALLTFFLRINNALLFPHQLNVGQNLPEQVFKTSQTKN